MHGCIVWSNDNGLETASLRESFELDTGVFDLKLWFSCRRENLSSLDEVASYMYFEHWGRRRILIQLVAKASSAGTSWIGLFV